MKRILLSGLFFLLLTTVSCVPNFYSVTAPKNEPETKAVTQIIQDSYNAEIKETDSETDNSAEDVPDTKQTEADAETETSAKDVPEIKKADAETETSAKDVPEIKKADAETETSAKDVPEIKKADAETETSAENISKTEKSAGNAPEIEDTAEAEKGDYKIGSGDILEIMTWKEPDFSKELLVRIDGKITFPLLDDIKVAGLTPMQVKKHIEKRLKDFVSHPIVNITVKNPQSQKFYILGEISGTGQYDIIKNLTVLQAFALAGGFTEWASKKEIILVRQEDGKEKIIRINYKNIARGKDFSQNILIKADDTIIVP
ncbi:polysaccharide biosynthesis/export family protein [Desulfonema magnum]|uniref:Polysaccharide export protein domain-containing n=1 Tax=Desulfonema magnum TaxID=45655 RepID=A0A975BHD1_9BACT|nr:polysaccharide biosynthesis/export family protein [Desulfonema magnum]QTA85537.1 Polysaccharide export protein domain-containing [Desulfonema magnum]